MRGAPELVTRLGRGGSERGRAVRRRLPGAHGRAVARIAVLEPSRTQAGRGLARSISSNGGLPGAGSGAPAAEGRCIG